MMANSFNAEHSMSRPLSRFSWWLLFLVSTYLMSLFFQAFKVFTLVPVLKNAFLCFLVVFLLFQVLLLLIYDSYVHEKSQGKILKPVRFLEWMINKRFLLRNRPEQKEVIK